MAEPAQEQQLAVKFAVTYLGIIMYTFNYLLNFHKKILLELTVWTVWNSTSTDPE